MTKQKTAADVECEREYEAMVHLGRVLYKAFHLDKLAVWFNSY